MINCVGFVCIIQCYFLRRLLLRIDCYFRHSFSSAESAESVEIDERLQGISGITKNHSGNTAVSDRSNRTQYCCLQGPARLQFQQPTHHQSIRSCHNISKLLFCFITAIRNRLDSLCVRFQYNTKYFQQNTKKM